MYPLNLTGFFNNIKKPVRSILKYYMHNKQEYVLHYCKIILFLLFNYYQKQSPIKLILKSILYSTVLLFATTAFCQIKKYQPITQEEYLDYFPIGINGAMAYNNKEVVYILPTNEPNKKEQDKLNKHFRIYLRNTFNVCDKYRNMHIITDLEAINQDLSNSNIYSLGTISGNLWTKQFLSIATDFKLKVYHDSIIADSSYKIDNYVLFAT
jgi:hypothetical protein